MRFLLIIFLLSASFDLCSQNIKENDIPPVIENNGYGFLGGKAELELFLKKNLNTCLPFNYGLTDSLYIGISVSVYVNSKGVAYDYKIGINDTDSKVCESEAIRVLKLVKLWKKPNKKQLLRNSGHGIYFVIIPPSFLIRSAPN